jgi:hypothetical protein
VPKVTFPMLTFVVATTGCGNEIEAAIRRVPKVTRAQLFKVMPL